MAFYTLIDDDGFSILEADGSFALPDELFGLVARYTDESNFLWFYAAGGNWALKKRIAGTDTVVTSGALGGLASYTDLRMIATTIWQEAIANDVYQFGTYNRSA